MKEPLVSILLLTRDGEDTLPEVLDAIGRQQAPFPFEIVAVDSASTDATVGLLEPRVDRLIRIPRESFNHGTTRNRGIEACRGELVVLLVQDAVPQDETWLARIVGPLEDDVTLAGSYARQVPRPGASAVTRHYLSGWAACSPTARTTSLASPSELWALSPRERLARCTFDNVCSCIRRSVWEQHPFAETEIAEDVEWARDVLLAGHRLAYVPESAVVHSHDRSARYELTRTYLVHRRFRTLFGLRTVPTLLHLALAVASSLRVHIGCLLRDSRRVVRRPSEIVRALALALAFPLGQYLGPLSADRGGKRPLLRGV